MSTASDSQRLGDDVRALLRDHALKSLSFIDAIDFSPYFNPQSAPAGAIAWVPRAIAGGSCGPHSTRPSPTAWVALTLLPPFTLCVLCKKCVAVEHRGRKPVAPGGFEVVAHVEGPTSSTRSRPVSSLGACSEQGRPRLEPHPRKLHSPGGCHNLRSCYKTKAASSFLTRSRRSRCNVW